MAEKQHDSEDHLQIVRGCPFPKADWFTKKNVEDAMDYVPQDEDLVLASYPKTGTTWMNYIILQIFSRGTFFPSFDDVTFKTVPYIEMAGIAAVEALDKPRFYKHHIAYNLVQKNDKAKCIYIYRHPEDTVVSYYHFSRNLGFYTAEFDVFFEDFLKGNIGYGNYFQHVLSFYEHREDPGLLMVSYEKLHANTKEEILRIARFLGDEYYTSLFESDELTSKIIEHTSFDYMKKNLTLTHPGKALGSSENDPKEQPKVVNFFRKGIVGDGKSTLTEEQQQRMKSAAKEILRETSIVDEWYKREK